MPISKFMFEPDGEGIALRCLQCYRRSTVGDVDYFDWCFCPYCGVKWTGEHTRNGVPKWVARYMCITGREPPEPRRPIVQWWFIEQRGTSGRWFKVDQCDRDTFSRKLILHRVNRFRREHPLSAYRVRIPKGND